MQMPYLRTTAPDVLATARAQRWDPAEVLRVLLSEEINGRNSATRRMRRKATNFLTGKTFSSWRPEESSTSEATQQSLMTLEWVGRHENLASAGPLVVRILILYVDCSRRSARCCDRNIV
jgi:DNA replication protein DnaC